MTLADPLAEHAPLVDDLTRQILAGRRFVVDDPKRDALAEAASAARGAVAAHLLRLPARFRGATIDRLAPQQHPGDVEAWLNHPDALTLWLVGDVGVGKTYAAAAAATAAAVRALRRNVRETPVRWHTVAGLLAALRDQETGPQTLRRAQQAPVLVLNDLAHTRPTEWAVEQLWLLVDHRVNAGLRQIVDTNAGWVDLEATWGAGTLDRLREGALRVQVEGVSRRRPVALSNADATGPRS